MSRIQSPSSTRADGDSIQENTLRIAEQEVSEGRKLPAAARGLCLGWLQFPVLNVWAVGACLCGFEGILHSDKSGGLPA